MTRTAADVITSYITVRTSSGALRRNSRFESNRSASRILIATPELEHRATRRKQRKDVSSNRQQPTVFAESYQTVYFRIPMQQELSSSLMGKWKEKREEKDGKGHCSRTHRSTHMRAACPWTTPSARSGFSVARNSSQPYSSNAPNRRPRLNPNRKYGLLEHASNH